MEFLAWKNVLGKILPKDLVRITDLQGSVSHGFDKCHPSDLKKHFCVLLLVGK